MKRLSKKSWIIIISCAALTLATLLTVLFAVIIPKRREAADWERFVREYYAAKLENYEAENEKYADYEVDVAFIGDSLTDGYDLKKYYPQYVTANRGIGGDTTFGLEDRLDISVIDLKPKVVVMLIGANNMDTMLENYESILQKLKTGLPETRVVVLSLTAMGGDNWGKKNQLAAYNNVSIKLLAKKYGFEFVDLYSALYDVSIGEVYEGYTVDGGHFTHEGYVVVTEQITPVLESLLGR